MAKVYWTGTTSGDASVGSNWSDGSVPTTGDEVYFDGSLSSVAVSSGLSGSGSLSGVALAAVHILDTFTASIGTASTPLKINPGDLYIHSPSGQTGSNASGSGRIHLDLEAVQCDVVVHGSKNTSSDTGLPPIRIKGTHASNTLTVAGSARLGVAINDPSEVATFAEINVVASGQNTSPIVILGAGCTLTTVELTTGTIINQGAAVTTAVVAGNGTYQAYGAGSHGTVNVRGTGKLDYNSTGTLATLSIGGGATADFSKDPRAKTVTNCTLNKGATLKINNGNSQSITFTNGIDVQNSGLHEVTIQTWPDQSLTLAAI